jgi:GH25 family lysozyme M1 (1,4-beta-N-acetylmuramidase)
MAGIKNPQKIFFRTLLYATSKKGRVIENFDVAPSFYPRVT